MTIRNALDACPGCGALRVDRGPCQGLQYKDGAWVGCTKCGLSVSGPDARLVEAAWRAIARSTAVREIRQEPEDPDTLPRDDFTF
jgi:hypothetical protein